MDALVEQFDRFTHPLWFTNLRQFNQVPHTFLAT